MHSGTTVCQRHPTLPQCAHAANHTAAAKSAPPAHHAAAAKSAPPRGAACSGLAVANLSAAATPPVVDVDVVVCRYAEDVSWLPKLMSGASSSVRGFVINHGPTAALHGGHAAHLFEWRTANAGNECGCYLAFIACMYPHFAQLTLFLQADAGHLGCLCQPALPFAYLGRNEWRSMEKGDTDRTCHGYNDRSCQITALWGAACERTARGLKLVGPGHANLQVSRERLLRHPISTWRRLASVVDGSTGRWGAQLCSNRARTRWFDCLVLERLWHRLMGEPGVLPRELALPQLALPARCNTTCPLRCAERECEGHVVPGAARRR